MKIRKKNESPFKPWQQRPWQVRAGFRDFIVGPSFAFALALFASEVVAASRQGVESTRCGHGLGETQTRLHFLISSDDKRLWALQKMD